MIHDIIFDNINNVVDYISALGWTLSKAYMKNAPYNVMDYGEGRLVYYPSPMFSPFYRGQNEFIDKCVASKFRLPLDIENDFIEEVKIEEFYQVTSKHPLIKEELENEIVYDHISLAQHYGFKTDILDLTNSLPVAAFFAVCIKEGEHYKPMGETDKPGVLYFIPPVIEMFPSEFTIYPVGWQAFTRPGEQRAFGIKLSNEKNFNDLPGIFAYRFKHDIEISKQILEQFNGGETLFPSDQFAEKAAKIKDGLIFSEKSFSEVHKRINGGLTVMEWKSKVQKKGVNIVVDSGWDYTQDDLKKIQIEMDNGAINRGRIAYSRLFCR